MGEIQKLIEQMKEIQTNLLGFIEDEASGDDYFSKLNENLENSKICDDRYKFKPLLQLISNISLNHQHGPNFYDKIYKVVFLIKDSIKNHFTNLEIFEMFSKDKLVLLFLIEKEIMILDASLICKIVANGYFDYFYPEIEKYKKEEWFPKELKSKMNKYLKEDFFEKRKNGQNDNIICEFIRKDMIKEFIVYIEKNNISLNSQILPSIYESNYHLRGRNSFISYAAFFGSIQIFNYLRMNGIELDSYLWYDAIRSRNPEILNIIEENHVRLDRSYLELLEEAILCYHNDIANYFLDNQLHAFDKKRLTLKLGIRHYNYEFISYELVDESLLTQLCLTDHYLIVNILIKNKKVNLNTGFYEAVNSNKNDIVKLLLTVGDIDVNRIHVI